MHSYIGIKTDMGKLKIVISAGSTAYIINIFDLLIHCTRHLNPCKSGVV